jgi:hypothetical protein
MRAPITYLGSRGEPAGILSAQIACLDEKSGQSNITSMRRVNHEMRGHSGFNNLIGLIGKPGKFGAPGCFP